MNSNHNNDRDYMGSKFSQQIFPSGEVDDIKDFKEEVTDDDHKEQFWDQAMSDSDYQGKFTVGNYFIKVR